MDSSLIVQILVGVFTAGGTVVALKLGLKNVVEQLGELKEIVKEHGKATAVISEKIAVTVYRLSNQEEEIVDLKKDIADIQTRIYTVESRIMGLGNKIS